jgi:hypothetical protein
VNSCRKIQLTASAVIGSGALALTLLSSGPAMASGCQNLVECTSASYCSAHGSDKFCPTQPGCRYVGQTTCSPPQNFGPCIGFYSYTCIYAPL